MKKWLTVLAVFIFKVSLGVYGCSFLLSNFPYMGKIIWEHVLQIFRHYFILCHCYRQVASTFTFVSDYSVKLPLLKCLRECEKKKLHVKIGVPKLQNLILPVLRRVVLLVHCIVPTVPISPQNHKMIWITIFLRSTAPQNLMLPSSVNSVIKNFEDFTLYVSIETLNTENRSDQEKKFGWRTHSGSCWGSQVERKVAFLLTCAGGFRTWKSETQSIQKCYREPQRKNCRQKHWSFLHQLKVFCESESSFWIVFEKGRRRRIQILLRTRFNYFYAHENNTLLDRSKLVCTRDNVAKLKDFLNKTDVIESCSRRRMITKWRFYKSRNLTVFAGLSQTCSNGWRNAVSLKLPLRNGSINCLRYEENTRQPYNDNLCLFRALALHLLGTQQLEEETSNLFNLFIIELDGLGADYFQGVHMNDIPIVEGLLTLNILLCDIDIVDGNIIGDLARRSVQKY